MDKSGWRLEIYPEHYSDSSVYARCHRHVTQRGIRICINDHWDKPITEKDLLAYARHEVIHALLDPVASLAQCRFVTEDEINAAEHEVLNRLFRLLP